VLKEPPKKDAHQFVSKSKEEICKLKNRRNRAAKLGHEVGQAGQDKGASKNLEANPA